MKKTTIAGTILIVFGLQGMFYGVFNYAMQSRKAGIEGEVAMHQPQREIVPFCIGAGASLIGLLLLTGGRKSD